MPLPVTAVSDSPAHLKILATPEANVQIDGRSRGAAPLADVVLPAGLHHIQLSCAPLGEMLSRDLRLAPGDALTIAGDFTGAKGRLLVRPSR